MRRAVGAILFGVGWVAVVYFGILAFVLLLGFAHGKAWVTVVTSIALPVGIVMVLMGNWLRERGWLWRAARERSIRADQAAQGPFGPPRGEP